MKTNNAVYFSRLDHLRFLAILLVLFRHFHAGITTPSSLSSFADFIKLWIVKGATGVSLFLVLSGFLFCVICDAGRKEIKYKDFLINRFLRIAPLLLVVFFIIITINRGQSTPMDVFRLLTLQLNTGNSVTGWGYSNFPSGPIWTIAVEFQFYLIFPFLVRILNQFGVSRLFSMMLCVILIRAIIAYSTTGPMYSNLYHSITGRLDQFLWGMILGYFYLETKAKTFNKMACIGLIVLSITINTALMPYSIDNYFYRIYSFNIEAFAWGMLILGYLKINININSILDRVFAYLGGLSYSLYLLHLPVGAILLGQLKIYGIENHGVTTTLFVILPVCIAVSSLTYYSIEKPFLAMRRKYTK